MPPLWTRRKLIASATAAFPASNTLRALTSAQAKTDASPRDRVEAALKIRQMAARMQSRRTVPQMTGNGDEVAFANRIACYSKALPHNRYGEVQPQAYSALLKAIESRKFADFEAIPRAGGRKLSNPQAAFAYHLEGGDPHTFYVPPAPSLGSPEAVWETNELYWQALCRDVPFSAYSSSEVVKAAAADLKTDVPGLFRGKTKADSTGPYVSQFLLKPIPQGAGRVEQKYNVPVPGSDFMTTVSEWTPIQDGFEPWRGATYEPKLRYIATGRDLAEYVHYDFAYQAYLGAALILINANAKSIHNCNQFKSANNPYRYSTVEEGFATFGPPEAIDWLGRVTTAALKAAYCQKWMVHRRLRPEQLGQLINANLIEHRSYPIHPEFGHSRAVAEVRQRTGTALLPQAYPEGCPMHPSYPAGHAAVAGACSVILKACFDGNMLLPGCVEPTDDGTALRPCLNYSPTINDEINKLATNVSTGRSWAGIHFRSDNDAGLMLGEEVALSILQDLALTFSEDFAGFSLQRFSGETVRITRTGGLKIERHG